MTIYLVPAITDGEGTRPNTGDLKLDEWSAGYDPAINMYVVTTPGDVRGAKAAGWQKYTPEEEEYLNAMSPARDLVPEPTTVDLTDAGEHPEDVESE